MKAAIYYYSGTGNTELMCRYVAAKIKTMPVELIDALKVRDIGWEKYDVVGFACFTDFMGISPYMRDCIHAIPLQNGKPAFVMNTYGNMTGRTLPTLAKAVRKRGFNVAAGHSLRCPENFPPMIAAGVTNDQAPAEQDMKALDGFIGTLNGILLQVQMNTAPYPAKLSPGLPDRMMYPVMSRFAAMVMMGKKMVDRGRCTTCGICKKGCPYGAITMTPHPTIDESLCAHCWRCYNRCPEKAIYTKKFKDKAMYPRPLDSVVEKLKP